MFIKNFTVGLFQTNMYVVSNRNGEILLVDPACQSEYERQSLRNYIDSLFPESNSVKPRVSIYATHGHLDHLWGAAWACDLYGVPVFMHESDIPMAKAMQSQYDLFGIPFPPQSFPIKPFDTQRSGSLSAFSILHTPGHTPGSVCFYWEKDHVLISGDTLFHMGYGRTDLPGGDTRQLIQSLEQLMALPAQTMVYPGHGDFTTIGAERR